MPLQISVFIYRFKSKNGCGVNQNTLFCFILLNMKPYRYAPRNTGGEKLRGRNASSSSTSTTSVEVIIILNLSKCAIF